jgi:hypothetical protein
MSTDPDQLNREHAVNWHRQHAETGHVYLRASIDFALEAIRTAALINGGAVIACLAFLGTLQTAEIRSSGLIEAVWFGAAVFTVGVVLAGLASGFGYFAQYLYGFEHNAVQLTWKHPYSSDLPSRRWWARSAGLLHALAAILVFTSYALVIFGALCIYSARGIS